MSHLDAPTVLAVTSYNPEAYFAYRVTLGADPTPSSVTAFNIIQYIQDSTVFDNITLQATDSNVVAIDATTFVIYVPVTEATVCQEYLQAIVSVIFSGTAGSAVSQYSDPVVSYLPPNPVTITNAFRTGTYSTDVIILITGACTSSGDVAYTTNVAYQYVNAGNTTFAVASGVTISVDGLTTYVTLPSIPDTATDVQVAMQQVLTYDDGVSIEYSVTSEMSNTFAVTENPVPPVPQDVVATYACGATIDITWTAIASNPFYTLDNYIVYRSRNGGAYVQVATPLTNSYTYSIVDPDDIGVALTFTVASVIENVGGYQETSDPSSPTTAITPCGVAAAPGNLSAVGYATSISFTFDQVDLTGTGLTGVQYVCRLVNVELLVDTTLNIPYDSMASSYSGEFDSLTAGSYSYTLTVRLDASCPSCPTVEGLVSTTTVSTGTGPIVFNRSYNSGTCEYSFDVYVNDGATANFSPGTVLTYVRDNTLYGGIVDIGLPDSTVLNWEAVCSAPYSGSYQAPLAQIELADVVGTDSAQALVECIANPYGVDLGNSYRVTLIPGTALPGGCYDLTILSIANVHAIATAAQTNVV